MIMRREELSGNGKAKGQPFGRWSLVRLIACVFLSLIGFFVVPILVVGILSPFGGIKGEVTWRTLSGWNLHHIGIAMHDYVNDHKTLPPAVVYDQHGKPLYSWRVLLLPYLEEKPLYSQFKLDEPWDSPNNKPLLAQMPHVYMTPSQYQRNEPYATHYQVFTGGGAIFEASPNARLLSFKDIAAADGTSKTLLVVEAAKPVPWTKPEDLSYSPNQPLPKLGGLFIKKGFHVMMADGSTRWLSIDIGEETIRAMITWNGHELVKLPE